MSAPPDIAHYFSLVLQLAVIPLIYQIHILERNLLAKLGEHNVEIERIKATTEMLKEANYHRESKQV